MPQARLLIVDNSRIAAGIARLADGDHALPPLVVLRADDGETATAAAAFLPAKAATVAIERRRRSTRSRRSASPPGTSGRPEGRDAVARQHPRQRRAVPRDGHGAARRPLPVDPAAVAHVRAHRRLLPAARDRRAGRVRRGIAQLADDLASQAPTVMFAVPRIFERFHARIERTLADSPAKRTLFDACVARGYRVATQARRRARSRCSCRCCARWSRRRCWRRLGGRLRLAVVGGAALDPELARTFIGLGLPMLQGYGMTEASPVISVNRDDDNVPESVGPPLAGRRGAAGRSERAARARRQRDAGLLAQRRGDARPRSTPTGGCAPATWPRSRTASIFIRGRAKDILVLSNGEKLPPQDVEFAILHDPVFEQVMLVGEGRPYLVLLAVTQETDEKALVKRANERLTDISALDARAARRRHARAVERRQRPADPDAEAQAAAAAASSRPRSTGRTRKRRLDAAYRTRRLPRPCGRSRSRRRPAPRRDERRGADRLVAAATPTRRS